MALKYWYVAGNGSAAWSVAGNWYNGSGGTGGVAGVPTVIDDAVVDAASGSGTLSITGTSTCNSLNTKTFTGTLAGTANLNISTSSIVNNNSIVLQLGGTHNYSGSITFTTSLISNSLDIECNGIFHKGNITFNSASGSWTSIMPLNLTGTLTLTAGEIYVVTLYAAAFSSSNANNRTFVFYDVYLSGTGALFNVSTQTNLNQGEVNNGLYSTSTASVNRSISITGIVYVNNIYIQGSGSALTSILTTSTQFYFPNIIISKTGGTLSIGQASIMSLTFIEGSTIQWASTTSQLTVYGNLILCNSMSISTSNNIFFSGGIIGVNYQEFRTFNKTFTGWLQVSDQGNFNTNLDVIGNYTSTTTSTNPQAINIANCSQVNFFGNINLTTGIGVNGTNPYGYSVGAYFQNVTSATSLAITSANVILGSATFSGNITFSSGYLQFDYNAIINTFAFLSTSNTTYRSLFLGNATINLNGNTGTIWQVGGIIQGTMFLDPGTSTININDKTLGSVTFVGGSGAYNNLTINRSNNFVNSTVYTIITGSNVFKNFKDLTINPNGTEHYIAFASSSITYIYDTFQVGNSVNLTRLVQTTSAPFVLDKVNPGLVICPNVYIGNSTAQAYNANAWYAISGSINAGGNSGWIFNTPPRRLGSLGAG